jgi:hypothetical protein
MVTATARTILAQQRYAQADLHDIRRAAERWWGLLEVIGASSGVGLSGPERALRDACATIMSRIRRDAVGKYHLCSLQMTFDEVDAA